MSNKEASAQSAQKSWVGILKIALCFLFCIFVGPAFFFFDGITSYFKGTATLKCYRAVVTPNDYFDQNLRVPRIVYRDRSHADFGHKPSELDLEITKMLNFLPNNKAIALMVRWFGPMKGTFQGAIPSKEEAFQAIKDVPKTVASEKFHRSGAKTGMPKNPRLIQQIQNVGGSAIMSPLTYGKVGWTTWQEETLIVGNDAAVWLIDKKRGRLYGGYTP